MIGNQKVKKIRSSRPGSKQNVVRHLLTCKIRAKTPGSMPKDSFGVDTIPDALKHPDLGSSALAGAGRLLLHHGHGHVLPPEF